MLTPKKIDKPIIVFTTFWDANAIVGNGFFFYRINDEVLKINLSDNFDVNSVALSHPKLDTKLGNLNSLPRIDFLCPTYDLLQRYKKDKNWEDYRKNYWVILKDRKERIMSWFNSLTPEHVYILCCWENTNFDNTHCHRRIIHNTMKTSLATKDKAFYIYRHGNESKKNNFETYLGEDYVDPEGRSFGSAFVIDALPTDY